MNESTFEEIKLGQLFMYKGNIFVKIIPLCGWNVVKVVDSMAYDHISSETMVFLQDTKDLVETQVYR